MFSNDKPVNNIYNKVSSIYFSKKCQKWEAKNSLYEDFMTRKAILPLRRVSLSLWGYGVFLVIMYTIYFYVFYLSSYFIIYFPLLHSLESTVFWRNYKNCFVYFLCSILVIYCKLLILDMFKFFNSDDYYYYYFWYYFQTKIIAMADARDCLFRIDVIFVYI